MDAQKELSAIIDQAIGALPLTSDGASASTCFFKQLEDSRPRTPRA